MWAFFGKYGYVYSVVIVYTDWQREVVMITVSLLHLCTCALQLHTYVKKHLRGKVILHALLQLCPSS